jgi:hypothetical protein
MSRRRHLIAIVLGLATIAITFATLESPVHALGSPVIAISVAGLATVLTVVRRERSARRH